MPPPPVASLPRAPTTPRSSAQTFRLRQAIRGCRPLAALEEGPLWSFAPIRRLLRTTRTTSPRTTQDAGGDCHSQVGPSQVHATGGGWTPGRILYRNGNRKTASSISTVILLAVAGGPGTRVIRPWRSTSLPPPPSPRNWYLVPASSATTS